jgi:hypothetical protein
MYSLSLQVELLHRQKPGTKSGLRTLEQIMQVRAALSFTIEQAKQNPSGIENRGVDDLFASFSRVIEVLASASSSLCGFLGPARLGNWRVSVGDFDGSNGLDNEVRAIEGGPG